MTGRGVGFGSAGGAEMTGIGADDDGLRGDGE